MNGLLPETRVVMHRVVCELVEKLLIWGAATKRAGGENRNGTPSRN